MAEKIQIKEELMQKVANDLKDAAQNAEDINEKIKKSTNTLLNNWEGESKEAFENEYEVLNANLMEYSEVLSDMAKMIEQISSAFVEQDKLLGDRMEK